MCVFTDEPETVADTQIFARGLDGRQILVYSMQYAARRDLAMVLPIPTVPGAPEEAVRFISLEGCPDFFEHLAAPFSHSGDYLSVGDEVDVLAGRLVVQDVGAYEASFVPSPGDFGRLDPRFRLPVAIWLEMRHYADWGFAVFKLKPTSLAAVHPMAFEFPRRDPLRLFFPTLHLHGPRLERHAAFDHMLYCQLQPEMSWRDDLSLPLWDASGRPVGEHVRCEEAAPLLDLEMGCWRTRLGGIRENRDTWIGRGEKLPERGGPWTPPRTEPSATR